MSEPGTVDIQDDSEPIPEQVEHSLELDRLSRREMLEVSKAARAGGMVVLRASKLKAIAQVGEYITKLGAIQLGRAYVVSNLQHIQIALEDISHEIRDSKDPEHRLALIEARNEVFNASARTADILIKSAETEKIATTTPQVIPAFQPGQTMASPIQINIHNQPNPHNAPPQDPNLALDPEPPDSVLMETSETPNPTGSSDDQPGPPG